MGYLAKPARKPATTAVERAHRQAERGDSRRAMLILREECFAVESDAGLWVHYGLACLRVRRRDEAFRALAHALWLRERDRDEKRAQVMRAIIAQLSEGAALPLAERKAA